MLKKKKKSSFPKVSLASIVVFLLILSALFLLLKTSVENPEKSNQFEDTPYIQFTKEEYWGDEAKDMFPDITSPKYLRKTDADGILLSDDPVLITKHEGDYYAYPLNMMTYHHIVNDVIGGKPYAITYCILTNTSVVYDRIVDGQNLELGVLGSLFNGNLVIYDKETDSHWFQMTGESGMGELKGKRLNNASNISFTSWGKAREFPNIRVLAPVETMDFYRKRYHMYEGEGRVTLGMNSLTTKNKPINTRIDPMTKGYGITVGAKSMYFPFKLIQERGLINTKVGDYSLLVWHDGYLGSSRIFKRFVKDRLLTFEKEGESYLRDLETATLWNFDGEAVEGRLKGEKLETPYYVSSYWFSWAAFYPETEIFE